MIRLTTLGTLRVERDERVELALSGQQPKRLALLTYLAVARPRGIHRRDTIVGLLWPELDQERARAALRQAVHAIRKAVGPAAIVSSGNEGLALDPETVSCDLWDLDDAAAAGDHEQVLRLYKGELAAGLFISGAPEFDQWIDAERARVRAMVRTSAWAAADAAAARLSAADAVAHARRALALSDLDESAVRRAMRLAAAVGDMASVAAIYEAFAADLLRDLEMEPSLETRALLDEVRRANAAASRAAERHEAQETSLGVRRESVAPGIAPSRRRYRRRNMVGVAAAVLVALVAAARLAPSATSSLDPRRVRIVEFSNESSVSALDTVARTASLAARSALVRLDNVRVESSDSTAGGDRRWLLHSDEAGTVVRGAVRVGRDSIELRAEVVDRSTGSIVRTVVGRIPAVVSSSAAVDSFADRVSAAVATTLYPGWGTALSQPPSYAGYRTFVEGMRNIKRERHDLAVAAFRRAYDEDSTFTAAGLLAAAELYQMRRYAAADSLATAIAARRALLPPVDRYLLDWVQRSLGGDRIGARSAMGAIVSLAPSADLAWLQLAIDNVETGRPAEAIAALDRIDPEAEFGEGWAGYWSTRLEALHIANDHERELTVARNALRRHPDLRVLVSYELRALAALGRVAEVERMVAALSATPVAAGFDPRASLRQTSLELSAHGNPAAARRVLSVVHEWYTTRPADEQSTLQYRIALARTAYLTDDRAEARRLYAGLLADHPSCVDCVGALGVLAGRSGNRAAADSSLTVLRQPPHPFHFGRRLEWQARIATALGDYAQAASLQMAAFASGSEFDVMTHADPDLRAIRPDSIYRAFARVDY